jgi:hypothetical protein
VSKKRQQRKRSKRADAFAGATVGPVVGECGCGQAAVVDCPVCGPQCMRCFVEGG